MYSHLNLNNIARMLEQLNSSPANSIQHAKKIDALLVQAAVSAENKTRKPTRPPQTHELRKFQLQYNVTQKLLYVDESSIQHMIASNTYLTNVTSKQQCVERIRTLRSTIRSLVKTKATQFAHQLEQELLDAKLANGTQLATALKNL